MDWGPPGSVITVEQFSALWFRQLFRFPQTVNLSCPSRRTEAVLARSRHLVNQYLLGAIAKVKVHHLTAPHLINVYGRMSDAEVTYADIQYVHEVLHKGFIDAERQGVVHGVVTNEVLIPSSDHGADILDRTTIALSSGHLLQLRCTGCRMSIILTDDDHQSFRAQSVERHKDPAPSKIHVKPEREEDTVGSTPPSGSIPLLLSPGDPITGNANEVEGPYGGLSDRWQPSWTWDP